MNTLHRFLEAQANNYPAALQEIRNGKKQTHWMWFIFPQIKGLGRSTTAQYYAITGLEEAEAFLQHPILGQRLVEISKELLKLPTNSAQDVFGSPDDLKLRSSMTLFAEVKNTHPVFRQILDKFYDGGADPKTLALIRHPEN